MSTIAAQLAAERPDRSKDHGVRIEPLHDGLVNADLRLTAKLLLGVVGFVLLTCCANVANLVLARTAGRARELGVRSALGAGGRRIARLLITESLLLAAIAAVLGAGLGAAILAAAPALLPAGMLPVDVSVAFDARVVVFCAAAGVALALVFGAVPAWQALRHHPLQSIASGGRTVSGGSRFRSLLVISEVAAAVVLLCGAGLLLRSLVALDHVDAGFRPSELLTMTVNLPFVRRDAAPGTPYATLEARRNFYRAIEREVRSTAGVRNVTWGSAMPLDGWWVGYGFRREGDPPLPEDQWDGTRYRAVGPSYFDMLGIRVTAGREFTGADTDRGAAVCVVNETFARRYLRDRTPIGSRLMIRGSNSGGGPLPVREVVGVVGDVKERPDEEGIQPQLYVPVEQDVPFQLTLVVEPAAGSAAALAPAVRAAVARGDKERPVANVMTMADISYRATSPARFRATVIGMFAALALTLAIVGVFGVLAYSVQQRVREFGVRIALGATTGKVLRLVFVSTGRMLTAGLLAGLAGAALLARSISSFLFGVTPLDPVTFAGVAILLALTAVCATLVPALRAARVDPIVALRDE
jgi:putative ABC transport system permease protein